MPATFDQIVGRVQLRCPSAGQFLVEDWVRTAFQEIEETRRWSWKYKFGQLLVPAIYNTGDASVTRGSTIVTGIGTTWTQAMVGRQFRTTSTNPIYTIRQVLSATALIIDSVWGGSTDTYNYQIYQCYFPMPSDFVSFISVWDPNFNWQLLTDWTQNELNAADAQRANTGNAYVLAWRDYTTASIGLVAPVVQVEGSGPSAVSAGNYTGPNDALFTVEITTGGLTGTAVFKWKKDEGTYTTGITTSASALTLLDGVQVYFPLDTYVQGDVFVISVQAGPNPGVPRYELWPHQQAQYVYPFLYWSKYPDISDPSVTIPQQLNSTLIEEMSLYKAASWPGPSADKPNPYYRLELADRHEKRGRSLLMEAERNDEETFMCDLYYQGVTAMPFAPVPALGDTNWLQSHDW